MISFKNQRWKKLTDNDLLVCTIGYESRSTYIYELNKNTRNEKNTLVFILQKSEYTDSILREIKEKGISVICCNYSDNVKVQKAIKDFFENCKKILNECSLHIDYSAMPRSWYCPLPMVLYPLLNTEYKVFMWYNAGDYPKIYEYPSVAINSISVYSGVSLPSVDIKRYHIMGLGFDATRTETVKSIIEPDALICCYTYNPNIQNLKECIFEINKRIIQSSFLSASLPIDSFCGMLDKLCGLAYDILSTNSQIILVPDGPKPLVFAMSLVPQIINLPGITCLHIVSNERYYPQIEIKPRQDEIWGFQIT